MQLIAATRLAGGIVKLVRRWGRVAAPVPSARRRDGGFS